MTSCDELLPGITQPRNRTFAEPCIVKRAGPDVATQGAHNLLVEQTIKETLKHMPAPVDIKMFEVMYFIYANW